MTEINFRKMVTQEEIATFWQRKREYDERDIFPRLTEEDRQYFKSEAYYESIMALHYQPKGASQGLQFVCFFLNNRYLGFTMYKIYTHEDGKAFILDYCVEPAYRNQGLGGEVFKALEDLLVVEGALFVELNSGEEGAPDSRFWQRQGFIASDRDEYGVMTYVKR